MSDIPRLPIWKRVLVAAQIVTLPAWILPYALIQGLWNLWPDIPWCYRTSWRIITAPLPGKDDQ